VSVQNVFNQYQKDFDKEVSIMFMDNIVREHFFVGLKYELK